MHEFTISAVATLDDGRCARFDATPWLRGCTLADLRALAAEGYADGPVAESVAHEACEFPGNEALDALLAAWGETEFLKLSVRIYADKVRDWLAHHRPDVLRALGQ